VLRRSLENMAKRRARTAHRTSTTSIIRAPAPIIRVSAPRAVTKHKKKGHRRSAASGGSLGKRATGALVGGWVLGYIDKNFPTLPVIPMLGKAGTIAGASYLLATKMHVKFAADVCLAAASVAGYEMATTGHILGEGVVSQV
jgi:hypothetical protein